MNGKRQTYVRDSSVLGGSEDTTYLVRPNGSTIRHHQSTFTIKSGEGAGRQQHHQGKDVQWGGKDVQRGGKDVQWGGNAQLLLDSYHAMWDESAPSCLGMFQPLNACLMNPDYPSVDPKCVDYSSYITRLSHMAYMVLVVHSDSDITWQS